MAKKKNRSRKTQQAKRSRVNQITSADRARGQAAIKTMIKGALGLALFICFFAFKIDGKTAYERVGELISGDESQETLEVKAGSKKTAKP